MVGGCEGDRKVAAESRSREGGRRLRSEEPIGRGLHFFGTRQLIASLELREE